MSKPTSFDAWYDANEPEDQLEKSDLLESVRKVERVGVYSTTRKGERLFVRRSDAEALVLGSKKARDAFIQYVEAQQVPDDMELRYRRIMADPRA